jgi:hypothetical protein
MSFLTVTSNVEKVDFDDLDADRHDHRAQRPLQFKIAMDKEWVESALKACKRR